MSTNSTSEADDSCDNYIILFDEKQFWMYYPINICYICIIIIIIIISLNFIIAHNNSIQRDANMYESVHMIVYNW